MGRRLYLFDIDGTLLLTGGAGSRALNRVFCSQHGISGAMDNVSAGGKTDALIIQEVFQEFLSRAPTDIEIENVLTEYVPLLREEIKIGKDRFIIFPDVLEVVRHLAKKDDVYLAIATGNIEEAAEIKLQHACLVEYFPIGGYGSDSAVRQELVEKAYVRACDFYGIEFLREEVWVIGDTPFDIRAARACQFAVVAVTTGSFTREQLQSYSPDRIVDTVADVL